ncbi:MAG: hypothetical protein RIS70_2492, partial [Planctomycetota bacterium]
FDSSTGKLKDADLCLLSEEDAKSLADRLRGGEFRVGNVEEKPYRNSPAPPFTTSSLQQEANRKLGFTARRTMDIAQSLYENGYITYMRTDSTNLAQVAIDAARDLVRTEYGAEFLPERPRTYTSKVKNAQEAHEAIRPAGHPFRLPESLRNELTPDQFRLFEMIWKRTIASQMVDAQGYLTTVTVEGGGAKFRASGKTIEFPGFLRAYVEGSDDPDAELADRETILPRVEVNERLQCNDLTAKVHTTQPPARFSEASLTQTLENMGIGRPSTYASIIDTILERRYVFKKGTALVPRWLGIAVARLMEERLPRLVDYSFTAKMEDFLDEVSRGEAEYVPYLKEFYFGDDHAGLHATIETMIRDVDARDVSRFAIGSPEDGATRDPIFVRVGKFGPFLEQGERKASLPEDLPPDEVTVPYAIDLLNQSSQAATPIGYCPDTGRPVYVKQGRFGAYVQMGPTETGEETPKNASLLKGMHPTDVTLPIALQLLSLPRVVGVHPESKEEIISQNGRFGPYIKCGTETRSLPAETSPISVTLEEAIQLLATPKTGGRRRAAVREPLRVLEASPDTNEPIRVLAGRYGNYVTDGQTNASLPKDVQPETLTIEQALMLLRERAAKGPAKKRGRRGAPAAKKETAKPAAKAAGGKKAARSKKNAKAAGDDA